MSEKQVHRLFTKFMQTEINLLTSPARLHANSVHLSLMHPPTLSYPSFLSRFCHLVSFCLPFYPIFFSLPFHPFLCSAALMTSAARKPSVLLSATNRHRQIKKHHSPINSTACLCSSVIIWE